MVGDELGLGTVLLLYCLAFVSLPWLVAFLIGEKRHGRHGDKEMYVREFLGGF